MYNRYIPQSDGSYRRNRIAESNQWPQKVPEQPANQNPLSSTNPSPMPFCPPEKANSKPSVNGGSVDSFLRQLLPKNFDTGDLLVILLLLLMAGDCKEEQNTALLTLGLYLFM